jgi:hypothetical protein
MLKLRYDNKYKSPIQDGIVPVNSLFANERNVNDDDKLELILDGILPMNWLLARLSSVK